MAQNPPCTLTLTPHYPLHLPSQHSMPKHRLSFSPNIQQLMTSYDSKMESSTHDDATDSKGKASFKSLFFKVSAYFVWFLVFKPILSTSPCHSHPHSYGCTPITGNITIIFCSAGGNITCQQCDVTKTAWWWIQSSAKHTIRSIKFNRIWSELIVLHALTSLTPSQYVNSLNPSPRLAVKEQAAADHHDPAISAAGTLKHTHFVRLAPVALTISLTIYYYYPLYWVDRYAKNVKKILPRSGPISMNALPPTSSFTDKVQSKKASMCQIRTIMNWPPCTQFYKVTCWQHLTTTEDEQLSKQSTNKLQMHGLIMAWLNVKHFIDKLWLTPTTPGSGCSHQAPPARMLHRSIPSSGANASKEPEWWNCIMLKRIEPKQRKSWEYNDFRLFNFL